MERGAGEDDLLDALLREEARCVFSEFDERTALALGLALCEAAAARAAPVVVDIRTSDRVLFHAAMPGSTPDNEHWARRKSNVTLRFHQSSLRVAEAFRRRGKIVDPAIGMEAMDYAAHGGSFPVRVRGVGVIAAITCSGLASADDHGLIVEVVTAFLAAPAVSADALG